MEISNLLSILYGLDVTGDIALRPLPLRMQKELMVKEYTMLMQMSSIALQSRQNWVPIEF